MASEVALKRGGSHIHITKVGALEGGGKIIKTALTPPFCLSSCVNLKRLVKFDTEAVQKCILH